MNKIIYLIPAYEPSARLVEVVQQLRTLTDDPLIVVDDGSSSDRRVYFDQVSSVAHTYVLRHAINLGKGAALKTGFNHALVQFPGATGVVTLDADGQHSPKDAIQIARALSAEEDHLVLGCREFSQKRDVPLRSRFGNQMTRKVFQLLTGVALSDTQTGLRGVPRKLMQIMLRIPSSGYDFETDNLIEAVRHGIKISERKISTLYFDQNSDSHFNPLRDSLRIYFVFVRFAFASIATACIDFLVFILAHLFVGNILISSIAGRIVAGTFNFMVSKRLVFRSRGNVAPEVLRYITLVAFFLFLSNAAVTVLVENLRANVYAAKILVETSLFLISFTAQRLIVFPISRGSSKKGESTDWDLYYQKPFQATSITRKITINRILSCFRLYGSHLQQPLVLELGGGNSCIYGSIADHLDPKKYVIIDKNSVGLKKFSETYPHAKDFELIQDDILDLKPLPQKADICFSIGLIEHFSEKGTEEAIRAHFNCVSPDGLVLITFPTPTFLYRVTRGIAELFHLWQFPDERPCSLDEVKSQIGKYANILHCSIIWPIFLTQGLIVARPRLESTRTTL